MVINLLSNAIKFSPDDGTVIVALEINDNEIKISVKDNGPGISEDQQEKIFEQFYQIDDSHTRKHGGTGIGLSLCKEYAEIMGGKILVNSVLGKGSEFVITLPINTEVVASEQKEYEFEVIPEEMHEVSLNGDGIEEIDETEEQEVVLIVEDNPDLNEYLKECLSAYKVIQTPNGLKGLEAAKKNIPDLIITDVMMPEMTGIEMTRALKNDMTTNHIPIIILSAKSALESRLEGLEAGANDYIFKPFNKDELITRLKNLLELRQALSNKYRQQSCQYQSAGGR